MAGMSAKGKIPRAASSKLMPQDILSFQMLPQATYPRTQALRGRLEPIP
jgi:hypothetical protein